MKSGIDIGFVLFSLVILYDGTFKGFINCIKDQIGFWLPVPDPRSFSPEIGATEPLKKSPGPAETMGSLEGTHLTKERVWTFDKTTCECKTTRT